MPAAKPAKSAKAPGEPPKLFDRYGLSWDRTQVNDLSLELACYREPAKYPTQKPREFHFKNAFRMVWPQYQWNEWCEMFTWAFCNYRLLSVIGHTRASKTFHFAHIALLDYFAADFATAVTLTTTKFDALKTRMWGDLMRAVESMRPEIMQYVMARYKITNSSNEMRLSINEPGRHGDDKFMIQGVATDSADTSAGKIRGQHADRRRIYGDEAQDIADAIFMAILNAMSAPDFIGVLLSNPVEKQSEFGKWCEPKNGWGSIHDTDLFWETTKPGGICLHLDGLQSPNIKAGKTVFPFLLTQQYADDVRSAKGEDSLEWWMYVRGFFPPDGLIARVWPSHAIEKARQKVSFDAQPSKCAVLDPAFDSDDCVFHLGEIGRLRNGRPCCQGLSSELIKVKVGPTELPKDYQIARRCIQLCKENGVAPEDFCSDETGNARGVIAIMRVEWSPKVGGVYYGGEATTRPLRLNDAMKANEQVRYFVSELWFRASLLAQEGMLCGLGNLGSKTEEDLQVRRYTIKQTGDRKLMVVEPKDEMKKRLGRSPDWGDAYCQFGELMVRKGMLAEFGHSAVAKIWTNSRRRAVQASARYNPEREFTFSEHG